MTSLASAGAEREEEEQWAALDEELIEDVELLRYIIKQQRTKLSAYKKRMADCAVKVI